MDPGEVELLAEKQLVTIFPNFRLSDKLYMISVSCHRLLESRLHLVLIRIATRLSPSYIPIMITIIASFFSGEYLPS